MTLALQMVETEAQGEDKKLRQSSETERHWGGAYIPRGYPQALPTPSPKLMICRTTLVPLITHPVLWKDLALLSGPMMGKTSFSKGLHPTFMNPHFQKDLAHETSAPPNPRPLFIRSSCLPAHFLRVTVLSIPFLSVASTSPRLKSSYSA